MPRRKQPHPGPFDFPGFFLSAGAITFTMIGAESIGLLPLWVQLCSWTLSLALWGVYILHARRETHPVLDLSLLRYRTVRASATGAFIFRLSLGATPFLMPLLLQGGLGFTPLEAGAFTMFSAIGAILGRPGAHLVISRLGYRTVMIVSAVTGGLLFMAPLLFGRGAPYVGVIVLIALSGLSRAYQLTSVNTIAFSEVPDKEVSRTTSLTAVLQQISLSLGITLGGLLLHLSQTLSPGRPQLAPDNFILPFVVIGLAAALSPLFYLGLPKDIGRGIAGRNKRH